MNRFLPLILLFLLCSPAWGATLAQVNANNQIGYIEAIASTYPDSTRDASTGTVTTTQIRIGQNLTTSPTTYYVRRSFLNFTIPTMTSCTADTLYLYGYSSDDSAVDYGIQIYTSTYGPTLAGGDFKNLSCWAASGAYDSTNVLNNVWWSSTYKTNDWNKIIFNAAGLAAIGAKSGDTLWVAILDNRDVGNLPPTGAGFNRFLTTTHVPYMSMTYETSVVSPSLSTTSATSIGYNTATLGGNITVTGRANPFERGIAYGASANPDTTNHVREHGNFGTGAFTLPVTGLTAGSTIHFRPYAINTGGMGYGPDSTFTTTTALVPTVANNGTPSIIRK